MGGPFVEGEELLLVGGAGRLLGVGLGLGVCKLM